MTEPGPSYTAPDFTGCYRHPDRLTGITCRRCRRPICGECMTEASVGFQCPKCVGLGRASVRQPKSGFGAALRRGGSPATKVIMGTLAAVWVLDLVTRGLVTGLLAMSNGYVQTGQLWRLVTSSLTSGQLFGVLMNLLVLWLAGRALEAELGSWRFAVLYLASGFGGATLFFLVAPLTAWSIGATSAIIGLLAANMIGKAKSGEDIRPDIGLLVLLVLYSVLVGFASFGWVTMIGGIIVGGLSGAILAYAPRQNRLTIQLVGMLALVAVCLGLVVAKLAF
ncbi:peptidase S54 family protein [Microlunatus phosphovorus NM-1]|uniref:Peptidase S54 family protein n=1 Tax=Microlunatus phosphovorus (strain ATCC 700054 / DSM 10555 / JCM 9379 / NBRC 101784 / NCIMB 13414 / VKM Ac-1990 / NM-1) TaxID=1032480 RepID=F5XRX7_MICPN|nr:rhomboid family intramembrane serine protease [Microlunatus phosphovorus]BAK37190.1 peptidase S54 family protein [Microlunatus phosphovorus NM-1]